MTSASFAIRKASLTDVPHIARIRVETWKAAYVGLVPQAVLERMTIEENIRLTERRFLEPERRTADDYLAWKDDEPLGWLGAGPCRDSDQSPGLAGEVSALYVLPAAWGTGVAQALMNFAAQEFIVCGFDRALVWVMEGNTRAERFYASMGYHPDGARRPLGSEDIPGFLQRLVRTLGSQGSG